jgi:hypothetical protein
MMRMTSDRWTGPEARASGAGVIAILLSSLLVPAASGQTSAPQTDAIPPAGSLEAPPEKIEPQRPIDPGAAPAPGAGTEELGRSGGVLQPPPTPDLGMTREPPDQGTATTPVIPPQDMPQRPSGAQPR